MSTALTVVSPEQFPIVATAQSMEVIRQNLGGEMPTPADFTRIKVPGGGGTTWEIPTVDGDVESTKEIVGIIVYIGPAERAMFRPGAPSGEPPQCTSKDCKTGIGDPGGDCETCPYNQFGSAKKADGSPGRGKLCRERKPIFILRADQTLPDVIFVPIKSRQAIKAYCLKLGVPYWSLVTRLTLTKQKSKDNIEYAQIVPSRVGMLPAETAKGILAYANGLKAVFEQAGSFEPADDDHEAVEV